MRAFRRGLVRFLRIYAAYFLLITAIVAVGYGVDVGGAGAITVCFLIAIALLYLPTRAGGIRWPKR